MILSDTTREKIATELKNMRTGDINPVLLTTFLSLQILQVSKIEWSDEGIEVRYKLTELGKTIEL